MSSLLTGVINMPDLVQLYNPKSKQYVLIDRDIGVILEHKETPGPWDGIPMAEMIETCKKVGSET